MTRFGEILATVSDEVVFTISTVFIIWGIEHSQWVNGNLLSLSNALLAQKLTWRIYGQLFAVRWMKLASQCDQIVIFSYKGSPINWSLIKLFLKNVIFKPNLDLRRLYNFPIQCVLRSLSEANYSTAFYVAHFEQAKKLILSTFGTNWATFYYDMSAGHTVPRHRHFT